MPPLEVSDGLPPLEVADGLPPPPPSFPPLHVSDGQQLGATVPSAKPAAAAPYSAIIIGAAALSFLLVAGCTCYFRLIKPRSYPPSLAPSVDPMPVIRLGHQSRGSRPIRAVTHPSATPDDVHWHDAAHFKLSPRNQLSPRHLPRGHPPRGPVPPRGPRPADPFLRDPSPPRPPLGPVRTTHVTPWGEGDSGKLDRPMEGGALALSQAPVEAARRSSVYSQALSRARRARDPAPQPAALPAPQHPRVGRARDPRATDAGRAFFGATPAVPVVVIPAGEDARPHARPHAAPQEHVPTPDFDSDLVWQQRVLCGGADPSNRSFDKESEAGGDGGDDGASAPGAARATRARRRIPSFGRIALRRRVADRKPKAASPSAYELESTTAENSLPALDLNALHGLGDGGAWSGLPMSGKSRFGSPRTECTEDTSEEASSSPTPSSHDPDGSNEHDRVSGNEDKEEEPRRHYI